MQKSFSAQAELFVSTADLEHPLLHSLNDTEALLEWAEIETLLLEAAQSGSGNSKDGKPKKGPEAGWYVKNDSRGNKRATYGFIHRQSVMPGNVHDSQERDTLLLGDETAL
ncbi:MAG: hypothetical protein A6F72_05720 [Cycloclasticus sp. symbiont of Poecilosclerida sp. N]|nr:MAG: hypothetical protein A6F72_05720 [Cycloclasticus sp. symbiont of Poecilosclerida sp. N]